MLRLKICTKGIVIDKLLPKAIRACPRLLRANERQTLALQSAIDEGIESGFDPDFDPEKHLQELKARKHG